MVHLMLPNYPESRQGLNIRNNLQSVTHDNYRKQFKDEFQQYFTLPKPTLVTNTVFNSRSRPQGPYNKTCNLQSINNHISENERILLEIQEACCRGDLETIRDYQYATENNGNVSEQSPPSFPEQDVTQSLINNLTSVIASISNSFDTLPSAFSPKNRNAFDQNENLDLNTYSQSSVDEPVDFDVDKIIDIDDTELSKDAKVHGFDLKESLFSKLERFDDDLENANSALKGLAFEGYTASLNPGNGSNFPSLNSSHCRSFQYPNSFITHRKHLANILPELSADLDVLANAGDTKGFTDYAAEKNAKLCRTSLVKKQNSNKIHWMSNQNNCNSEIACSVFPSNPELRQDFTFRNSIEHAADQSYRKTLHCQPNLDFPSSNLYPPVNNVCQKNNIAPMNYCRPRTPTTNTNPKKESLIWPDFPHTAEEFTSIPVEKFNEVIKTLDRARRHIAKDIRRKGKNKLAARHCRKRKMDKMENLDSGVEQLEKRRRELLQENQKIKEETQNIRSKTEWLNSHIFEHLRDANGKKYSTSEYSLQYTSDGNAYLVLSRFQQTVKVTTEKD